MKTTLWFILGTLTCISVLPLEPNLLEEGFMVDIAQRMLRGDHLFRDIVAFTGPLPYELLSLLFRVFGEHLLVGRFAIAILHGVATCSVYLLAREARTGAMAHAAAMAVACAPVILFPLFAIYFYTTLSFSLALIATFALHRGIHSNPWALTGGVLVACTALCKQTVGATLAPVLLLALLGNCAAQDRLRRALAFSAGGALVAILTLATYALRGDLNALVYSLVTLPLSFESSFDAPYMNFWPPGQFSDAVQPSRIFYLPFIYTLKYGVWITPGVLITLLTQLLYALPLLAIFGTLLRRAAGPLSAASWFHLAALLALVTNLFPRADWGHLVFVLPSAFVQLTLLTLPVRQGSAAPPRWRLGTTLVLSLVLAAGSAATLTALYRTSTPASFGPRIPLRPVSAGFRSWPVPHAIAYLRERVSPGEAIFVARAEPLLYFATDTRNPTPYGGVIPGIREEQQRVIIKALEDLRYVVMSDIDQPVYTYYRDELPAVQQHLERHFHVPADYLSKGDSWILVLEKGADRGATAIDFADLYDSGHAWIRSSEGRLAPAPLFTEKLATRLNRRLLPFHLGPLGGGIDFELDVPAGAVFQGDFGYPKASTSKVIYEHTRRTQLRVSIARAGSENFEVLTSTPPLTFPDNSPARWLPTEIDLAGYAGERVTLRMELISARPLARGRIGWWGSPRIALRPEIAGALQP